MWKRKKYPTKKIPINQKTKPAKDLKDCLNIV